MLKTVFFDLDGTLLPMDQDIFVKAYLGAMAEKMASHGFGPGKLVKSIWAGTGAMTVNCSDQTNEEIFWTAAAAVYGQDLRPSEPLFRAFYETEFQNIRTVCGFDPRAGETIALLKQMGYRLVLATNPLFPAVATYNRIRWAGLDPADFELVTTYENSSRCKPNPAYYREILDKLNINPEECLMVGNDAREDAAAAETGMRVFLLTDCLINRDDTDISRYPNGSFPELLDYIRSLSV